MCGQGCPPRSGEGGGLKNRLVVAIDKSKESKSKIAEAHMRMSSKGQLTIPLGGRNALGLFPMSELEYTIKGESLVLRKASRKVTRGKALVERLRGARAGITMSTDEIMALTRGKGS